MRLGCFFRDYLDMISSSVALAKTPIFNPQGFSSSGDATSFTNRTELFDSYCCTSLLSIIISLSVGLQSYMDDMRCFVARERKARFNVSTAIEILIIKAPTSRLV